GKTEEEIYAKLGLDWIPPELREARGEIALARERRLPRLVELTDIRGDLQMHTSATDGKGTIDEMAHAARALGYQYIAITDHSKRVTMAVGFDAKRLGGQWEPNAIVTRFEGAAMAVYWYARDRKKRRLNSSHVAISYATFSLKKKR